MSALFPKNIPRYHSNYIAGLNFRENILVYNQFPWRAPLLIGGIYIFGHPADISINPFSALFLLFNEIEADNLLWALFYIFGALSMFYLCRHVLEYTIYGSIFSSIVFAMSGHFAYLHEDGLSQARSTLLLPLLIGFLFKAKNNKRYIVFTAIILAFISFEAGQFLPFILLFMSLIVLLEASNFSHTKLILDKRYIKIFFAICILAFLFSSIKSFSVITSFGLTAIRPHVSYAEAIRNPNTLQLFYQRLLLPYNYGPGTMYTGWIPSILCLISSIIYLHKKIMKVFVVCLILSIWFSFGPNAPFDLHKILRHLPIFNAISEIAKYYSLVIVLFVSAISGYFFFVFEKIKKRNIIKLLSLILITFVFVDLLWANIGYFNTFNTELPHLKNKKNNNSFHMAAFNAHRGNETILDPLSYFFMQNNIGLLNPDQDTYLNKTNVIPKYFLLPRYGFLMPYTSLMVLPNPYYREEVFFLKDYSEATVSRFGPNEIIVNVKITTPDILIINQNYDKSWNTDVGKVTNYNNLLAVKFDETVNSRVRLTYSPEIFIIGLIISSLSLMFSGVYVFRNK